MSISSSLKGYPCCLKSKEINQLLDVPGLLAKDKMNRKQDNSKAFVFNMGFG